MVLAQPAVTARLGLDSYYPNSSPTPARLAKLLKAARRDRRLHLPRWELVKELQERRDELARAPANFEPTLDAAFEKASKALRGTKAAGAPDTIKKSWLLVERRFQARHQD